MKLTVAISGASGTNLGVKFVKLLPKDIEVFLVFSNSAKRALKLETKVSAKKLFSDYENVTILKDSDIGACIASGSFKVDKMIILPCTMNTLAKCAVGISDSLITRAFTVMLKEKKGDINFPKRNAIKSNSIRKYAKTS